MNNKTFYFLAILMTISFYACKNREIRENKQMGVLLEQYEVIKSDNGSFVKDGFYKKWYDNGTLRKSGFYEDGKMNGKWQEWNKDGKVLKETHYSKDSLNGEYKEWYENGQISCEQNFTNGQLNGRNLLWYDNGNPLLEVENMIDGKYDKKLKYYFKNKQISVESEYTDGVELYHKEWNELGNLIIDAKLGDKENDFLSNKWKVTENQSIEFKPDNTYLVLDNNGKTLSVGEYKISYSTNFPSIGKFDILFDNKDKQQIMKLLNDTMIWENRYTVNVKKHSWFYSYTEKQNRVKKTILTRIK